MEAFLIQVAHGAVAILVAVLAIYLSLKLLGKIAKFVIGAVVIGLVVWFLLSDNSILQSIKDMLALPLVWSYL
jgi:hypothetical protein